MQGRIYERADHFWPPEKLASGSIGDSLSCAIDGLIGENSARFGGARFSAVSENPNVAAASIQVDDNWTPRLVADCLQPGQTWINVEMQIGEQTASTQVEVTVRGAGVFAESAVWDFRTCAASGHEQEASHANLADHGWELDAAAEQGFSQMTVTAYGLRGVCDQAASQTAPADLSLTISIEQAGYYALDINAAAMKNGGKTCLLIDGIPLEEWTGKGSTAGKSSVGNRSGNTLAGCGGTHSELPPL